MQFTDNCKVACSALPRPGISSYEWVEISVSDVPEVWRNTPCARKGFSLRPPDRQGEYACVLKNGKKQYLVSRIKSFPRNIDKSLPTKYHKGNYALPTKKVYVDNITRQNLLSKVLSSLQDDSLNVHEDNTHIDPINILAKKLLEEDMEKDQDDEDDKPEAQRTLQKQKKPITKQKTKIDTIINQLKKNPTFVINANEAQILKLNNQISSLEKNLNISEDEKKRIIEELLDTQRLSRQQIEQLTDDLGMQKRMVEELLEKGEGKDILNLYLQAKINFLPREVKLSDIMNKELLKKYNTITDQLDDNQKKKVGNYIKYVMAGYTQDYKEDLPRTFISQKRKKLVGEGKTKKEIEIIMSSLDDVKFETALQSVDDFYNL